MNEIENIISIIISNRARRGAPWLPAPRVPLPAGTNRGKTEQPTGAKTGKSG